MNMNSFIIFIPLVFIERGIEVDSSACVLREHVMINVRIVLEQFKPVVSRHSQLIALVISITASAVSLF